METGLDQTTDTDLESFGESELTPEEQVAYAEALHAVPEWRQRLGKEMILYGLTEQAWGGPIEDSEIVTAVQKGARAPFEPPQLPEGYDRDPAAQLDPLVNPVMLLFAGLMACDGYGPWTDPEAQFLHRRRVGSSRVRSVQLAAFLQMSPEKLASALRRLGVAPRTMRFQPVPLLPSLTKGYRREDVCAALSWIRYRDA